MKLIFLSFLFISYSHAYTLNNNFGASFKSNQVKVYIDGGTVCSLNAMTVNELESLVSPAIDKFWNKVPTSNLELEAAGFSDPVPTMNNGRLCSPTDAACIAAGAADVNGLIPPIKEIVIACNNNPSNFGSSNVIAVTVPNNFGGKKITGAVILINENPSATFGELSRADQIAVLAHEIGHAIGLGHSEDNSALMFYRTVSLRRSLGQDDIDGVSYLYPRKIDMGGLLGGCGTITQINNPPKDPPFFQMLLAFGLMIILFEMLKLLIRSKARPTT